MHDQYKKEPMRIRGEDVLEGLRDWVKSDLKESPKLGYDLGKFFFSVSVGTIGTLAALEKLRPSSGMSGILAFSFAVLFLSIVLALLMAIPRKSAIGGDTDLYIEYMKSVDRIVFRSWVWFSLWLIGTGLGAWAIRR